MPLSYAFMTFSTPDLSLAENLRVARELGYAGIEPRCQAQHAHGIEADISPAARGAIRDAVAASGIALAALATSCRYANPADEESVSQTTRDHVNLARDLGCPRLRVFGGAFPDSMTRDAAITHCARVLTPLAAYAAERGVTLCLETHDAWTVPEHVAALMTAVDSPGLAVNWDIMHPVRQGGVTMDQAFETLRPWIRHVHVHDGRDLDGKLQMLPIGEGIVDHRRALALLLRMGYTGYISGEWIKWQPWDQHLPRELALLKALEAKAGA